MDILNRPPAIAEDTLEYTLLPSVLLSDKASVTTLATLIDSHVRSLLPNHIWHRDAFELKVVNAPYARDKWMIEGRMRVGDCVDDEWCVVWLLRDISRHWDVVVSVFDSDGEFLLIEAAHYLPAWVTPSNAENRVWIHNGHLHLVPLQHISSPNTKRDTRRKPGRSGSEDEDEEDSKNSDTYISASDAVQVVRNPSMDTLAPQEMERAAMRRIEGYPALARQHIHRTKAYLPRDIAIALLNDPTLVQKAIEAFYTRDAIQLRAATRMTRFSPSSSILFTVTMTRAAYAQLVGQRFHPPKVFGTWKEIEGTKEWRWKDVGMKIACGFEMLYQESKGRHEAVVNRLDSGDVLDEARKDALRRDIEYTTYIKKLQDVGYFKNEAEGSGAWKELENQAAAQFMKFRRIDDMNRISFTSLVNAAIFQGKINVPRRLDDGEDSEEWLTIDENTVDDMLIDSNRQKTSAGHEGRTMDLDEIRREKLEDKFATNQAENLRNLAEKVEKFVEAPGDVEGATFEDDLISEGDDDLSHFTDSDDESMFDSQGGSVDPSAERQAAMDLLVPALEPSEYGKMPSSFYNNSQKVKGTTTESESASGEQSLNQNVQFEPKPMRPLIFPRDQFDGVEDSDDESEAEEGGGVGGDDEEDEEDEPIIVGEVDIDMQQEEEEFLEFSRNALGVTPDMWNDIVKDRKGRGAFLPASALQESSRDTQHQMSPPPPSETATDSVQQRSDSGQRMNTNPTLDSFEAVMQAMDAELSRAKRVKQAAGTRTVPTMPSEHREQSKGKAKQRVNEDEDVETAMEAELRAGLQDASVEEIQEDAEAPVDYTLIKNFLESFKGQHGLSGPVGNLVGRLQPGWKLPRDES